MTFRNPLYLDLNLLANMADYYGVDIGRDAKVKVTQSRGRSGRANIERTIGVAVDRSSSQEMTQEFDSEFRPVRAMNDLIDQLLQDKEIVDLDSGDQPVITQRMVLQVDGIAEVSAATEVGAMMSSFLPLLSQAADERRDFSEVDPTEAIGALLNPDIGASFVQVLELESESLEVPAVVLVNPENYFGNSTVEDIEGEVTILANVEKVISNGRSYPLQRYFLPGLSRPIRRAIAKEGLEGIIESMSDYIDRPVDTSSLSVAGPAVILRPIAIY